MLKKKKYEDMRSCWEFGEAEECRRGLMYGMGYSKEEIDRPLIGVVNSWNEYNPGHVHLDKLAARVKQGVREAGGLPLEVMTTGICDGMVLKDPKYIEVPSRNSIADQVEMTVDGNFFDGMVLLSEKETVVADAPKVQVKSTVGAGDSALAGFIVGFVKGHPTAECVRLASACGTACAQQDGTGVATKDTANDCLPSITVK